jgi:ribosomal protein L37AE/L43A
MHQRYTVRHWRSEHSELHRGGAPAKCPQCTRTGFYAPRDDHPEKPGKPFRACSFCGFWQDVGKDPTKALMFECHGHTVIRPSGSTWSCPTCGREFTGQTKEAWPAEDTAHQWWHVPQNLSQEEYITYWSLEWGHDAKPFGIVWLP